MMSSDRPGNSQPATGDNPARPWQMATAALAVALVLCLGALAQGTQRGEAQATVTVTAGAGQTASGQAEQPPATASKNAQQDAAIDALARRQEGDPMAKGRVDAPVVMIEYADYRCPFCSVFAEDTLPQLQPLIDDGTLRVEFHDMAIFGEDSINAAAAARAAGEQGLFWEFQAALYARLPNQGHPDVKDDLVMEIAQQVGVKDMSAFETAYRAQETREAVVRHTEEAKGLGIRGTPFFFVGRQQISGAQPLEVFQQAIQQQRNA